MHMSREDGGRGVSEVGFVGSVWSSPNSRVMVFRLWPRPPAVYRETWGEGAEGVPRRLPHHLEGHLGRRGSERRMAQAPESDGQKAGVVGQPQE
jgi:hypothetical protein